MSKLLIAVPCMDSVSAVFAHSLANLKHDGDIKFQVGSLVHEAREKLADIALEEGYTHVLWLDSDMHFQPDTLERLRDHHKPFVTGVYYRRQYPYLPTVFKREDDLMKTVFDIPEEPFMVDACGFGCVLMDVDMIREIKAKYGTCFNPYGLMGEDIAFCIRAKELDYGIWCDPTIELGHAGTVIITKQAYEDARKEQE